MTLIGELRAEITEEKPDAPGRRLEPGQSADHRLHRPAISVGQRHACGDHSRADNG